MSSPDAALPADLSAEEYQTWRAVQQANAFHTVGYLQATTCPYCGYCPHCGRSAQPVQPWTPPYMPANPYGPWGGNVYPWGTTIGTTTVPMGGQHTIITY